MLDFDAAFERLLGNEGGYVCDPKDPGGETQWGISKRSYPQVDIKNLTQAQAKEIYMRDFWMPLGAAAHPAVKFQVFDFAVNASISTAIRKLQLAVGVADDGHWGPASAEALDLQPLNDTLMRFAAFRLQFYTKCKGWPDFGAGWTNRIAQDLLYSAEDN